MRHRLFDYWPAAAVGVALAALLLLLYRTKAIDSAELQGAAGVIGAMIGAYAGAAAAVWFQARKDEKLETDQSVRQVNLALIQLVGRYSAVKGLQSQAIDPIRDSPYRHLELRRLIPHPPGRALDLESLRAVAISGTDGANLVLEAIAQERECEKLYQIIEQRNQLHLEMQRAAVASGLAPDRAADPLKILAAVDKATEYHLRQLTNILINSIDENCSAYLGLILRLSDFARARFPGHPVIEYYANEFPSFRARH